MNKTNLSVSGFEVNFNNDSILLYDSNDNCLSEILFYDDSVFKFAINSFLINFKLLDYVGSDRFYLAAFN